MHKPLENLDPLETIAGCTDYPMAVLTDTEHSQIETIGVDDITEAIRESLQARGLHFVAVCGILGGKPEIEMVYPLPEHIAFAVGAAYTEYLSGMRAKEPEYDWVSRRYHH